MRASITVALLILLFSIPNSGQQVEHAPTAQQCQADQAVWGDKLDASAEDWGHTVKDTTALTIIAWGTEMGSCRIVDPANYSKYLYVQERGLLVLGSRKAHFMNRHDLNKQFFDEDTAGQR